MAGMISGRLASVLVGAAELVGSMSWNYSGGIRRVIEAPETFDAAYIEKLVRQIEGGEIEVTGAITNIDDPAWLALITAFHVGTTYAYDGIKFFINATDYLTPDNALSPTPYVWLSKCPDAIVHEASGVAQISLTFVVCGQMELVQPA